MRLSEYRVSFPAATDPDGPSDFSLLVVAASPEQAEEQVFREMEAINLGLGLKTRRSRDRFKVVWSGP